MFIWLHQHASLSFHFSVHFFVIIPTLTLYALHAATAAATATVGAVAVAGGCTVRSGIERVNGLEEGSDGGLERINARQRVIYRDQKK